MSNTRKKILTIGAYERDNFGDFLFFWIARESLKDTGCEIVPSSIFESDMRDYIGEYVFPYHLLLSNYDWDAVWIVGGEIGGADIRSAFDMSIDKGLYNLYLSFSQLGRDEILRYMSGGVQNQLAYLPDFNLYKKTKLIINSVGGFEALNNCKESKLFNKVTHSLKTADIVSVRNDNTHNYLGSLGIQNDLVPDVVHALPFFYSSKKKCDEKYILFHANEYTLNKCFAENMAKILTEIMERYACKMYLFIAGSARLHDDEAGYIKLKTYIEKEGCGYSVDIIKDKNPLNLVDWIAGAEFWIGTSLHGRIISIAYETKRVGLENEKVSNYCKLWDKAFPYDVNLNDLVSSVRDADRVDLNYIKNKSKNLSEKSKKNLDNIVKKIYESN